MEYETLHQTLSSVYANTLSQDTVKCPFYCQNGHQADALMSSTKTNKGQENQMEQFNGQKGGVQRIWEDMKTWIKPFRDQSERLKTLCKP